MLIIILGLCINLDLSKAYAGGFTISVMGGRRASSLVNLAKPDDPSALFHNPAGLADLDSLHVQVANAFFLMQTDFKMKALDPQFYPGINPADCSTNGNPECPWPINEEGYYNKTIEPERFFGTVPYFGITSNLGTLNPGLKDVTIGFSLYSPAFYGAKMPDGAPTDYTVMEGMFLVGSAAFGAGWRINDYLSVGASLSYNYMRLDAKRKFSTVRSLTPLEDEQPSSEGIMAQSMIGDLTMTYTGIDHGVSWVTGLIFSPSSLLSVGLSYWGSTKGKFEGPVSITAKGEVELDKLLDFTGYKLPDRIETQIPIPHALQIGFIIFPTDWLEVGMDLRTWHYQLFGKQNTNPIYNSNKEEGVEAIKAEDLSIDKEYTMSYEIAFGFLAHFSKNVELLAGGSYDKSPIPDKTFTLENPSLSSWNAAAGVRWRINENWRICLSHTQYFYETRQIDNSITSPLSNGKGTGTAYLPAFEVEYIH